MPGRAVAVSLVNEEPHGDWTRADHMEGVNDVVEPEPDDGLHELVFRQFALVEGATSLQEVTGPRRRLLIDPAQVLAEMTGVRGRKVLQRHPLIRPVSHLQQ